MKYIVWLSLAAFSASGFAQDSKPITVVELFTSQGCSSCPPADTNLSKLARRTIDDRQIVTLSFHVDYWDRLGWKDPFSDERFTLRQRRYAQVMKLNRIYTPQMVVNGQYEFVGSNASLIDKAMELPVPKLEHTVTAELKSVSATEIQVESSLTGTTEGWLANFALVQATGENDVPRGENARRHLKHSSIVRAFEVQTAGEKMTAQLKLPDDFQRQGASVVVYVQNQSTGAIDGATILKLDSEQPAS